MCPSTLLPAPRLLRLECVVPTAEVITLVGATVQERAVCPLCVCPSGRVHSRYQRTVADLPWQGVAVRFRLTTRRFFCDNGDCRRVVFAEPLPQVVARYARRTDRLADALRLIGYALGGEAGARLAEDLGLAVSPDTLLRRLRHTAPPPAQTPRVLGVDDWAYRRGHRYGTLLVDLERRRPVDLLPDREAGTLAAWLQAHPGVEVISRDRASAYAQGAREGAPGAVQVADRWHLLRNLGDAFARLLLRHQDKFSEAAKQPDSDGAVALTEAVTPFPPVTDSAPVTSKDQESARRRERRLARYTRTHELRDRGLTVEAIARQVGIGERTVSRYLRADAFPERSRRRRAARPLDALSPYLRRRWDEGCRNAAQLFREVKKQGYVGGYTGVWNAVQELCASGVGGSKGKTRASPPPIPSVYSVAWWLQGHFSTKPEAQAHQKGFVERPCRLVPALEQAQSLAQEFVRIVKEQRPSELGAWLGRAEACALVEFQLFAAGLRQDLAAVTAALSSEWSNGQTEGQVNRLKTLKRQMFGRAGFDLLRARVLPAC